MEIIGVISSDEEQNKIINQTYQVANLNNFKLVFLTNINEVHNFINYDLPEIVIVNFSDPNLPAESIIKEFKNDVWLHSFGIIGIYKQSTIQEEELLASLKELNVLSLMDEYRVRSHLMKSIEIIHINQQIIFQKGLGSAIMNNSSGSFMIPNDILSVPIYAGLVATNLLQAGKISSDRKMHLQLALSELIVNGIEHGNCGISYHEKTDFMETGNSIVELVEEKCKDVAIANKRVKLEWETGKDTTKYTITDEGEGFNTDKINRLLKTQDKYSLHGRGTKMACNLSKDVYYNEKGNRVTLVIDHDKLAESHFPIFYKKEEILTVKRGDIVLREGEESDFLYYISSGRFYVFHNNKRVGEINRNDIFMGEMSFLLRNKRNGTIKAVEDGKLIKISRNDFITLIRDYPYYGIFLSSLIAKRLVKANQTNANLLRQLGNNYSKS